VLERPFVREMGRRHAQRRRRAVGRQQRGQRQIVVLVLIVLSAGAVVVLRAASLSVGVWVRERGRMRIMNEMFQEKMRND